MREAMKRPFPGAKAAVPTLSAVSSTSYVVPGSAQVTISGLL
jgi:hypothetical protein